MVEAEHRLTDAAMRERVLALAKARGMAYAYVVRTMGGGSAGSDPSAIIAEIMADARPGGAERGRSLLRVYKRFADGHEEMVRGAQVLALRVGAFKEIVAATSTSAVLHGSAGSGVGAILPGGGSAMSTFVAPSLLFDDLTITERSDQPRKLPITGPPGDDR